MGDGSGDLQIPWQVYFGKFFYAVSILDVGAGIGKSKPRLQYNLNAVVTQDINPIREGLVDTIKPIEEITTEFDYVVSFDVIEHVENWESFLKEKKRLAIKGSLDTTPNWHMYPTTWHFTAVQFYDMYYTIFNDDYEYRYFFRIRGNGLDYIEETSKSIFLDDKTTSAYGLLATKRS
jgi:hypothetical protein